MKTLPIYERGLTWQGEGVHMGRRAFFIRTFGCPVGCDFCDAAGTWHPDYVPKNVDRMTAQAIADEAIDSEAELVVITGGEPCIHDLRELTVLLGQMGLLRHLETCGAYELKGEVDWMTLSPKRNKPPIRSMVSMAHEFKFIIEKPEDIRFYFDMIWEDGYYCDSDEPIWLHPEWTKRNDKNVLSAISNAVKHGVELNTGYRVETFRAGWQLHKLFNVDSEDERMRSLVPIGGNPEKGY